MILSVELHNFLSHRHSVIHLHELNNIFVGASDSGKSAFIKGIKWCRWNRPLGDDFYSWPEVRDDKDKDMWVKVTMTDHVVTRKKGKQEEYILDGVSFKAFGTNVPQEIVKAFNIEEVNWQNQLDSHFLLNLSAGDAATYFNKVAKLDAIDRGTNSINSSIRELTSDIKYKTEQETKLISNISIYPDIEIFTYEVEVLELLEKEKTVLANSVNKLHAVTSAYRIADANFKEKSEILKLEHPLNNILDLIDQKKHTEANFQKLNGILLLIHHNECKIADIDKTLTLEQSVSALLELYKNRQTQYEAHQRLFKTMQDISGIQVRITNGNAFLEAKNKEWEDAMPVGSICSLCGQEIRR